MSQDVRKTCGYFIPPPIIFCQLNIIVEEKIANRSPSGSSAMNNFKGLPSLMPLALCKSKHDDEARLNLKPGTKDPTSSQKGKSNPALVCAWMLDTMVRVDSEPGGVKRFPKLALGLTKSLPNVGVSKEAVSLMKFALRTGL